MNKSILQRYLTIILMAVVFAPLGIAQEKNLYSFTVKAIDGSDLALSVFQGKKVLIVNVASKCGLTPQYEKLQVLYEKYHDKDFVILGFPANNFGAQEPGTNEEIFAFCTSTYQVTFPMMSKISVKEEDMDPLYEWLTQKELNGKEDAPVTWNFQKFMIDENGNWVGFAEPKTDPFAEEIVEWIEK
ncbi:Hydroperoxy fatty acid reductase gpx1 [termite gut metagenome]|uniref:Hydroperoxy fatty acid reductase gpx1 n=1 Tax=termite gut metagenome TaxID=433724 RepID=A0A5J4RVP2_9ZZZZ